MAVSAARVREIGDEREAHALALEIPGGIGIVEFYRVDEINGASGAVLRLFLHGRHWRTEVVMRQWD